MCKESAKLGSAAGVNANSFAWLSLLGQMLCSVLAGVYNEVLLKSDGVKPAGVKVTTNLQNAFMYLNSIVWNGIFLAAKGTLDEALSPANWEAICTPVVLSVIGIMSSVGLVTGFFLKHLDSVLKAIASALEVVATCLLSFFLFGVPLDFFTVVAATAVGTGVALYSRPVTPPRADYEMLPGAAR